MQPQVTGKVKKRRNWKEDIEFTREEENTDLRRLKKNNYLANVSATNIGKRIVASP